MVKLKPGDRIDCLIFQNKIVSPYSTEYDLVKSFEIIGIEGTGYYLHIPSYMFLQGTIKIDKYLCNKAKIHHKYLSDFALYIKENMVYKVIYLLDGCACSRCQEFFSMAEPNQSNGTFICHQCLYNPFR